MAWRRRGDLAGLAALLALAAGVLLAAGTGAGAERQVAAGLVLASWLALCAACLRRAAIDAGALLVAYASQSGHAAQLARQTAATLARGGLAPLLLPLAELDAGRLRQVRRACFVVSTYGDGEPPDGALGFARRVMQARPDLSGLEYAVLALGDRDYAHFCAFGRALDGWLRACGAVELGLVEVDRDDPQALAAWARRLEALGAGTAQFGAEAQVQMELRQRTLLNPGSAGAPLHQLDLACPAGPGPAWRAGDLVEIHAQHDPQALARWLAVLGLPPSAAVTTADGGPTTLAELAAGSELPAAERLAGLDATQVAASLQPLRPRDYSIASLPADGQVRLLVRLHQRPDGAPGLASDWLCRQLQPGQPVRLRLRSNPAFHAPPAHCKLILIGNGTGMAGLRAHLRERAAQPGAAPAWLLYGERSAATDGWFLDELQAWQAAGVLERIDLAWSRDPCACRYVQDCLRAQREPLAAWIAAGAVVMVCGSRIGMAAAVDAALADILGGAAVEALAAAGRYRRDVY